MFNLDTRDFYSSKIVLCLYLKSLYSFKSWYYCYIGMILRR